MKSLLVASSAVVICLVACSSGSSGTFIPNEGGTGEGGTGKTGTVGPDGKVPTGGECAGDTQASAAVCTGNVCIKLNSNEQGKNGICSETCDTGTCTKGGVCLAVPAAGNVCFEECTADKDCTDGFVCVAAGDSKVCLVNATGTTVNDGGTNAAARCTAATCSSSTTPADIAAACGNFPAAAAVCDCPGAGPASPCVASELGGTLYCCP